MNIVLIHGQNHRGSSCSLGRRLAEKLSAPEEREEFFLPRDLNHFCTGCLRCLQQQEACPFYKEKQRILDAMEKADLLIFTTPTYCMHASAPMKSFLDLNFSSWMVHRPRASMFRKQAVILSTAAGSGTGSAIRDIKSSLSFWGIPRIYSWGLALQAPDLQHMTPSRQAAAEKQLNRLAKKIAAHPHPMPGIRTRFLFSMMRSMQASGKGADPAEREYWQARGWLGTARPWKA